MLGMLAVSLCRAIPVVRSATIEPLDFDLAAFGYK
jgi:hypothetical protein